MTYLDYLWSRHRGKRILPDANLLLLYLVGSFQRTLIPVFKRTAGYSELDFDLLAVFLAEFKSIVTTPHLLTEVNSLANALPERLKGDWCDHFSDQVRTFIEVLQPATTRVAGTSLQSIWSC